MNKVFNKQKEFLAKFLKDKYNLELDSLSKEEQQKWTKEMILSCSKETHELLDIIKWKTHRYEQNSEINNDNFLEQTVDAFKYLLNICILNGITDESFYTKFEEKSKIVDIRFEQEKKLYLSQNDPSVRYVVFDIDGVINDYPLNVMRYMNTDNLKEYKKSNYTSYKKLKQEFRTTGQERNNVVNNDTKKLLDVLSTNYKIILLTARPYEQESRLYYDTIHWLTNEGIKYDYLFFSEQKEEFLLNNFNPDQIAFVVDDQIDNINKLCNTFKTFLLFNPNLYSVDDTKLVKNNVNIITHINELFTKFVDTLEA